MPRKKRSSSPFEIMDDDFDDTSSQSSRNGNPPIRNAANARERARMRVLSSAFGRLKTKLPNIPADTKLSKLDTLRLATMYIKQLKTAIDGGSASPTTNGEIVEGSLNSSPINCYLNLNSGAQSMNWPFGFHHHLNNHLNNSSSGRSTSSSSLINNTTNWSQMDSNNDQLQKHTSYENEHYHQIEQQQQHHSYSLQHLTSPEQNTHNQDNHHWYSETPSPELDTSSNMGLSFENSNLHQQAQQQQQQQPHHLSHLQPAITHSSTFRLHHFQHQHQLHHHQQTEHIQHGFVNSSNFQSTSIR